MSEREVLGLCNLRSGELVAYRPNRVINGLALPVAVTSDTDGTPAKHFAAWAPGNELNAAGTKSNWRGGLPATEGHCHPTIPGYVVMTLQDLTIGHNNCYRPTICAPPNELDFGVADFPGCIV